MQKFEIETFKIDKKNKKILKDRAYKEFGLAGNDSYYRK